MYIYIYIYTHIYEYNWPYMRTDHTRPSECHQIAQPNDPIFLGGIITPK